MMGRVEGEAEEGGGRREPAALTSTPLALIRDVFAAERRLNRRHLLFSYGCERLTSRMGFHIRGTHRPHHASSLL